MHPSCILLARTRTGSWEFPSERTRDPFRGFTLEYLNVNPFDFEDDENRVWPGSERSFVLLCLWFRVNFQETPEESTPETGAHLYIYIYMCTFCLYVSLIDKLVVFTHGPHFRFDLSETPFFAALTEKLFFKLTGRGSVFLSAPQETAPPAEEAEEAEPGS